MLSTSFKDAVVDALIAKLISQNTAPTNLQDVTYPKSSSKAKIRKLLVDIAVRGWTDSVFEDVGSCDPSEFFFDLAFALYKANGGRRKGKAPYEEEDTCAYHDHVDKAPCYKTMF